MEKKQQQKKTRNKIHVQVFFIDVLLKLILFAGPKIAGQNSKIIVLFEMVAVNSSFVLFGVS